MTEGRLENLAQDFTEETDSLLIGVFRDVPAIEVVKYHNNYVIRPSNDAGRPTGVSLTIQGEPVASLWFDFRCRFDRTEEFLAVEGSSFQLKAALDRAPIFRFEYERSMDKAPHAHIHVHAHRGALSHLLSQSKHATPHDMASLHLPVGGSRLRPCLEDVVQFLVEECGFDAQEGWKDYVEEGRERWRRRQIRALVRDVPSEAVPILQRLGYAIEPPEVPPEDEEKALRAW